MSWQHRTAFEGAIMAKLIVMLTHNDMTVEGAGQIFEECKHIKGVDWGFKDVGIPLEELKALGKTMKEAGKTVYIESLEETEEECLKSAQICYECHADYMIGSTYFESVRDWLHEHGMKYVPDAGTCVGRPARLLGTIESITADAQVLKEKGVDGMDLAAYRFDGDSGALIRSVVSTGAPIYIAGSINSFERIKEVSDAGVVAFTIGGAFFENKFEGTFGEQIEKVANFLN